MILISEISLSIEDALYAAMDEESHLIVKNQARPKITRMTVPMVSV